MIFNRKAISINYIFEQIGPIGLLFRSVVLMFFKFVRSINKIIAHQNDEILIISLHRLGDTVFTIPAIKELYKKFGHRLTIVCYSHSVPIYNLEISDIKFIVINSEDYLFGGRIAKSGLKKKLKKIKPGLVIDITGSMKSASLIFSLRAKTIIGTNGDQFKSIYDQFVKFRTEPRLSDIYLDVIRPILEISTQKENLTEKVRLNSSGKILLHPFAGWNEKEWGVKKFANLAIILNENFNVGFIIQDNQFSSDVIDEIGSYNVEVIQSKSSNHLTETIRESSFFIGNDSGPVNLANYLGIPTLTIFGATNPDYTSEYTEHQIYLQKVVKCSARKDEKFCSIGGMVYCCSGVQCMNLLSVEEVYKKIIPLLNKYCEKKISEPV